MRKPVFIIAQITILILFSLGIAAQAYAHPLAAERHMARGAVAMEIANSQVDYLDAVKEFSEAVKLAPDWIDAWFNLGVAQESAEDYQATINSFKTYLKIAPKASDAGAVQKRIFKLEYRVEKQLKQNKEAPVSANLQLPEINGLWEKWANGKIIYVAELRIDGKDIQERILKSYSEPFIVPHENWNTLAKDFLFDGRKFSATHQRGGSDWTLSVANENLLIEKFYNSAFGWNHAEWKRKH